MFQWRWCVSGGRKWGERQIEKMLLRVKVSLINRSQADNMPERLVIVWKERIPWCANNSPVLRGDLIRMTDET